MEEIIGQLISLVQDVTPELWRIALKEVQVKAVVNWMVLALAASFLAISIVGFVKFLKSFLKAEEEGNYSREEKYFWLSIIAGVAIFVLSVWVAMLVAGAVSYYVNPEYQAIMVLFDLVK